MPPHHRRSAAVRLAAFAGSALLALGPAPAAAPPAGAGDGGPAEAAAALVVARDRAARADAAIDDLKRELRPGHLTDAMPDTDRAYGLAPLRSDYADAQRRAAGYRATLGDQHPSLVAADQLLAELRGQLLDATRKALAAAEHDAADARADAGAAERRLAPAAAPAGRPADATGSVKAAVRPASTPLSLPPVADAERPAPAPSGTRTTAPASRPLRLLMEAAAVALGLALLAGWAALRLLRPRRPRPARGPERRIEPAVAPPAAPGAKAAAAEPARSAAPVEAVPVLQRLTLPRASGPEALLAALAAAPRGGAADALHDTLRAALGGAGERRMTVLVAPAAGLADRDADAAALALAVAAAGAGRRPLLMEARPRGCLRGALVPAEAMPAVIEAGGAARTLYRLGRGDVAVLPSDPGEAEAADAAARRADAARLCGLAAFDTVFLLGDDAPALAASADLLLLAAPVGAAASALSAAAARLRAAGRPCGAVLVERGAGRAAPTPAGSAASPERRPAPDHAARLGLRGSIAPGRRRAGA